MGGAPTDALAPFYEQTLQWTACGDLQCTTARVPIDYADPAAGSIDLALNRLPASSGEAVGSLLVNPGGPGASGVEFVSAGGSERVSERVRDRYDLVGFDPRGVQSSAPVTCLDDAAKDELLSRDFDFSTDAGIEEARAAYRALGEACAENTGSLLGHVDTVSAARDLDVLRAALGDESLTYLGYSYGTSLGANYAELFPDRVGRLVLDGALDPRLDAAEVGRQQAVGFENALRAYVEDCQGGESCPLTGSVDEGMAQVAELLDRARRNPLETESGRPLTATLAFYGIAFTLYDDANWGVLTDALTQALRGDDGTFLLYIADLYNERNEDGSFASNKTEAFTAVNCLDGAPSSDPAQMSAEAAQVREVAPTVASFFSYGGVVCQDWPYPASGSAGPLTAPGAAPIVVIGTTNDPATPYVWAQGLAEQLESGVLVTWEGEGHTAYGRSNDCVADAVDGYLLEGTVPEDGLTC
ncbi:alpha/beta hydrolase [Cellulomonas aerilata]|uniref:Alpha/beta hydrolase n=1 Tax=Cellulomonas aerilata TaxID=515326 RepID=A0A512DER6_9CELL|nr:alpha/beta hydrolase [Cellulomonas aerilata]